MEEIYKLFLEYPYKSYQNKIQKMDRDKLASFFTSRFFSKKNVINNLYGIASINYLKQFSTVLDVDVFLLGDLLLKAKNEHNYDEIINEVVGIVHKTSDKENKFLIAKEPINHNVLINSLIEKGFYYICGESIFTLDMDLIKNIDFTDFSKIRIAKESDAKRIEYLSQYSHEDIRYYYDCNFDRKKVSNFYKKIASQSITNKNEVCFVYEENEEVQGFITVLLNKNLSKMMGRGYCSLDYISVNPKQQKKGIGYVLNNYAIDYLKRNKYEINVVKTMASNYRAIGLLMKNQFTLTSQNVVYHCKI